MKHLLALALLCTFGFTSSLQAQLPDGAIAPNWTLTDIDGNTHTLYDYLDAGKMVIIEFSATWCGPCWNYMLTGALETVWEEHGPNGDNTAMLFYIEADQSTGMADLLGQTAASQGNWVEAIPFPIIDLQAGDNQDAQYQIAYYPTLYAVCSDYSIWELGQVPASVWSSYIESCTLEGFVDAVNDAECGGDGSVTVDYSGGVAPISYDWSNGENDQTIQNVDAGTYSVTITEGGGKWVVLEDIVVGGPAVALGLESAEVDQPLCNGASNGVLDIEIEGGTPGYGYDWSNGSSNEDLTNVPAGTYSVVVTDENGCTFEEEFVVDEPDPIDAEAELTPENCFQEDGTITLDLSGGTGGYELSATSGDVFGHSIINLSEGPVTVTVEDQNGCLWEQDYEIGFLNAPELEIYQGDDLDCIQMTTTLTSFAWSGSGDFEYAWSTTDGHIVSGTTQETITLDEEGTYSVTVTDFISGCESELSYTVEADIVLPEVTAGADLPISCEASQLNIQGSGDPLNTISWTTVDGNIVSGGDTYTPLVNEPGIYTINVTHSVTGCSTTDEVIILDEVNPANASYQYLTNSLTVITTDNSTGSNVGGWSWTFGDGATSNEQSPVHTYAAGGTYEVCLTVSNGCGPSTTCSQVEVTSSGSVLSLDGQVNNVLCNGGSTGSIILVVNGGSGNYTYTWTGPGGTTYNTPAIDSLVSGAYVVIVSDDQGNSVVGGYTVEEPAPLQIGASTVTDNVCFGETNGSITVDMAGGVGPYLYSWNGGAQQPENSITQLAGGSYECLVTDANGCTTLVGPYQVTEPSAITSSNVIGNALCYGDANGSAALTVSGGVAPYLYQWSANEVQTPEINGLPAGNYACQITDANGCVVEIGVIIGEPAVIEVNVTEKKDATGPGHNDGSITIQVSGGTEPFVVTWSNGATGLSIQGLVPGEYTYSLVDAHGCTYTSPAPVVILGTVSNTEPDGTVYVSLTPNPSNGKVVVRWKQLSVQNSILTIMTLDGRKLDTYEVSSPEGTWDLGYLGLAEGLYVVMLQHQEKVYPFKLIIL